MSNYSLAKSASMQPRTSLPKFLNIGGSEMSGQGPQVLALHHAFGLDAFLRQLDALRGGAASSVAKLQFIQRVSGHSLEALISHSQ